MLGEVARMKCSLFHPGLQYLTQYEIKNISSGLLRLMLMGQVEQLAT